MTVDEQLAAAEAEVERLKRLKASADCNVVGCNMVSVGGANAGCADDCACSVPVHECTKCGDSDYGDNDEARKIRAGCSRRDHEGGGH